MIAVLISKSSQSGERLRGRSCAASDVAIFIDTPPPPSSGSLEVQCQCLLHPLPLRRRYCKRFLGIGPITCTQRRICKLSRRVAVSPAQSDEMLIKNGRPDLVLVTAVVAIAAYLVRITNSNRAVNQVVEKGDARSKQSWTLVEDDQAYSCIWSSYAVSGMPA
ncbi:uncharacterized protein MYCFIDRAFT_177113 [Pseudocercospora fijiensis CIRAD86]|uniref:Uncharacterized protein n=1 Tax=Pseudocercospora fijiensis (strain CIRAD86) TaxID=383855 RepID=M3ASL2_PSEFD|nr:uncharacterized protein MYCFIDRAFT_177113 [Pseudocercospora fijiensis CIRAD86]EME80138.1 hypothetical protein MYCFIDRAFT_177113 [Pseudocercospora fijiensis CIRAD86]